MSFKDVAIPQVQQLSSALAAEGAKAGGQTGYLEYKSRSNSWLFGSTKAKVDGETIMVHPGMFVRGWIAFDAANRPTKVVRNLTQEPVALESLPPVPVGSKDGWQEVFGLSGIFVGGDFADEQFAYEPASFGGRSACQELAALISQQLQVDHTHPFAVVVLGSDSYKHAKHGITYTPQFTFGYWADIDGYSAEDEAPALAAAEAEAAPVQEQVEVATVEVDVEAPEGVHTPVRRRRRG